MNIGNLNILLYFYTGLFFLWWSVCIKIVLHHQTIFTSPFNILPTSDNFFFLHIQSYHCTFFFLHTQSYHCTFFFSTHNSITVQIFSPHTILSLYNFFPVQAFKIYVNIPVPLTILSKGYNSDLNRNGSTSEIQGNIICTYI